MRIRRHYELHDVNWVLVPDLMSKVERAALSQKLIIGGFELLPRSRFDVLTFSQNVELDLPEEFLYFLRSSGEPPRSIQVEVECNLKSVDSRLPNPPLIRDSPAFLNLEWGKGRILVELSRLPSSEAMPLLEAIESTLQLVPATPPARRESDKRVPDRKVFLAHSFDETGRSYAYQLTKFLTLLGFEVATGDGYSPEKVSSKVRRRLLAQEVVIAVVSKKDDLTWLIQEMTGADFAKKPLIPMVEQGVDLKPGLLGDLEYIPFKGTCFAEVFSPLLEGLRELGFGFTS